MRNQQFLKLLLVLLISITYIFSFSHFAALAYGSFVNSKDVYEEGTTIGSLSVAGKTSNDALKLIDEQLTKWLNEATITVKYKEKSQLVDLNAFTFNLDKTISGMSQGELNHVSVEFSSLEEVLFTLFPSLILEELLIDEIRNELLQMASLLEVGSYELRLEDFLIDGRVNSLGIIAETSISVESVARELELFSEKKIEVPATSQFSLLKFVEKEIGEVSHLAISKIATSIYNVILPTNFTIIERHISNELPHYATLGFEARADIALNNDLVFSNPNEFSYFIEFEKKNDSLKVFLKGPNLLNKYVILTEGKEKFSPKIIRQFNPELGPTEINIKVKGKEGQLIKVYREHRDEVGAVIKKEFIAEDFYPPIHQVEVQGLIVKDIGDITEQVNKNEASETSNDNTSSSKNNTGETTDNIPTPNPDDDLWGKENEIQK